VLSEYFKPKKSQNFIIEKLYTKIYRTRQIKGQQLRGVPRRKLREKLILTLS